MLVATSVLVLSPKPTVPLNHLSVKLLDSSSDATTTTTTLPSAPDDTVDINPNNVTAPADFPTQVENYYNAVFTVAASAGTASASASLATPSAFDSQVASMTPDELSDLYQASTPYIDYGTAVTTIQQAAATSTVTAATFHVSSRQVGARRSTRQSARDAVTDVSVQSPTVIPTTEPTTGSWAGDVSGLGLEYLATCPTGAPTSNDPYGEYDQFAIGEGIAAALAIFNILGAGNPLFDLPIVGPAIQTGFAVADAVVAVILAALQIAHDVLTWEQGVAGDCLAVDIQLLSNDEDNNAYQDFELLTGVAATTNEIDTNIVTLTNQESAEQTKVITLSIEEALSAPLSSIPQADMELPATDGGYLDATPGVQEVVVNAISALSNEGQLSSNTATRDLGLAEQAQTSGEFKLAFTYYQMAYQAAGQ